MAIRTELGAPCSFAVVLKARMLYFWRVLVAAPPLLVALLQATADAPNSWASQVLSGLDAMRRLLAQLVDMPAPRLGLGVWCDLAVHHPADWRGLVKEATALPQVPVAETPAVGAKDLVTRRALLL